MYSIAPNPFPHTSTRAFLAITLPPPSQVEKFWKYDSPAGRGGRKLCYYFLTIIHIIYLYQAIIKLIHTCKLHERERIFFQQLGQLLCPFSHRYLFDFDLLYQYNLIQNNNKKYVNTMKNLSTANL